jgi:hypothetical protein
LLQDGKKKKKVDTPCRRAPTLRRERARAAEQRAAALSAQLAPFDAAFFSELRQLKAEHEELRRRCAQHEAAAAAAPAAAE